MLYRHDPGGPVERAQVTYVEFPGPRTDPYVWDESGNLLPDPNPEVFLRTKAAPGQERRTREARTTGSPGWLWPEDAGSAPHRPPPAGPKKNAIELLPEEQAAVEAGTAQACGYTCACHGGHRCMRAQHRDEAGHRTEHVARGLFPDEDGELVEQWVTWTGPCKAPVKRGEK